MGQSLPWHCLVAARWCCSTHALQSEVAGTGKSKYWRQLTGRIHGFSLAQKWRTLGVGVGVGVGVGAGVGAGLGLG